MEELLSLLNVIREIHKTPTKAVIIATGGGTGIFPIMLERGGGSSTLLSGMIPYSQDETISILGGKPEKFVSEHTARSLAMAAYQKAVKLCTDGSPVVGLSCTASLQTIPRSEEREGRKHRVFMALQTHNKTISIVYEMEQLTGPEDITGIHHRIWEENVCVQGIVGLLAEGCGVRAHLTFDETVHITRKEFQSEELGQLLANKIPMVTFNGNANSGHVIFSGSFNPVHEGHMEMVSLIRNNENIKPENRTVAFEISIRNVDKPPLDFLTIQERIEQFTKMGETVHITNAPNFIEKSALFKGRNFIVGYDTAVRILDPRYVGPIDKVLQTFKDNGNYFYIFPRQSMASFSLPGEYMMGARAFEHMSSTQARKAVQV